MNFIEKPVADFDSNVAYSRDVDAPDLRLFVFGLFFVFGGITSLNDVIIPKLKELFTLGYAEALLVQSAFFAAYALFSLPAAAIVRRVGYMRTACLGLVIMMIGCLIFIPASSSATFGLFLVALFVLAAGITIVQVVANPLISMLGPRVTAHSRLTFAQAFNSLGTTLFPYVGSILILGGLASVDPSTLSGAALDAYRAEESQVVVNTYLVLAAALAIVTVTVWTRRDRLEQEPQDDAGIFAAFGLLKRPRFAWGVLCIFLYVGAEVAIGSLIVNYLMQPHVLASTDLEAGKLVAFYWGGALIGRFGGAWVLRKISPGLVLFAVSIGAILLLSVSANTSGALSAWSLLAIGLMNSIMFPTIFSLACEGLGKRAADGSGLIATAIVGGAIVPPLTGAVADATGSLQFAMILPGICYVAIAGFGLFARRPAAPVLASSMNI